jgi:hypothetical protein
MHSHYKGINIYIKRFFQTFLFFKSILKSFKMNKIFTSIVCIFILTNVNAQISLDSTFTLSGSVDVYYRGNFNASNDLSSGATVAPGSSFANNPGFALGMFNLKGTFSQPKYGFVADLVFGPREKDAVFNAPGGLNIVNQLYGYYQLSDKVKVTLGNFNTYLGYEVISPVGNLNYSTSYLFSYGPFNHTGLKLDFALGGGFTLTGALMNPTDFTLYNPNGKLYYGAQLGHAGGSGSVFLNYLGGDGYNQVDLTASRQLTSKFFGGINASLASDNFSGLALYTKISATDNVAIGVRGEYFKNIDNSAIVLVNPDESVYDLTFSLNVVKDKFRLIPELRFDIHSNDAIVLETDSKGDPKKSGKNLASFVLAGVYSF